MTAKTISKEELKQPDSFQRFFDRLAIWAKKNAKNLWIGLIVCGLAVTAVLVQNQKNKRMNQEAANAYIKVIESLPLDTEQPSEEAWNKFADATENYIDQYKSSTMAPLMMMHRAKALLHTKKYEEATKVYQNAQTRLAFPYNLMAQEGEALSYQFQEKYDQSLSIWQKLVAKEDNPFKDYHLWNLGLNLEKTGKPADAMQVYDQIIADFADSAFLAKAKMQKTLLEK
ncbi:MAG: tetratricopeptide repeat protein [Deltaproteobacteria bacterium]|nr:tetratricopeptide repeat protein [Deltaproteobacteria bacterium]